MRNKRFRSQIFLQPRDEHLVVVACFESVRVILRRLPTHDEREIRWRLDALREQASFWFGEQLMMEKLLLPGLAAEFRSMAEQLDVDPSYKAFHTTPQQDGTPHVETRSGKFEFVVTERGSELERISGLDNDEILYLLFEGVTFMMATSYELRNRKPTGDGRAVWFPYQEKLMAGLKPSWGVRLKAEHEQILRKSPLQP